ncbi:hypothetical protein CEUSTIGMA_g8753.t1 [Chlamydomonas eustigma]|uniref:C2 domain-containing protein n=1 Tax=Chlamydomonas eustigma TaxID=1157962 RepID=A0A250XEH9_9CHLO|nr:hypothetical protein CEUSTIGMA_g8753.t1 [Chlamydomonas eustigma]|eukprot:GAX81322.1 hypothetical protein CEUSTIGMA_g8753.t1 [Chlamydomonas eustigma]
MMSAPRVMERPQHSLLSNNMLHTTLFRGRTFHNFLLNTPLSSHCFRTTQPRGTVTYDSSPSSQPSIHTSQTDRSTAPVFDLPLAVALAGASFESYLQPEGGAVFTEPGPGDGKKSVNVVFADKDFLLRVYQGVLIVDVVSASNLRIADTFTPTSDPYAVLSIGASSARTEVIMRNLNPQWDKRLMLYVGDLEKDVLKVRLFDMDFLKSDDDLGYAMLPLKGMQDAHDMEVELPITGPAAGDNNPKIKLCLNFVAFSSLPASAIRDMVAVKAVMPERATNQPGSKWKGRRMERLAIDFLRRRKRDKEGGFQALLGSGLDTVAAAVGQAADMAVTAAQTAAASAVKKEDAEEETEKEEELVEQWKALAVMVADGGGSTFMPLAYVDCEESDTQVWLFADQKKREAVVAFRGTEQVKWKDLITDLNLAPVSLNPEGIDEDRNLFFPLRLAKAIVPSDEVQVHGGFSSAYNSVRRQVVHLLDTLTTSSGSDAAAVSASTSDSWRVMITGHSLGGALATICAYDLSVRLSPVKKLQRISMYSFGAPRAGNKKFSEQYNLVVRDSWRCTNSKDVVPSVPRLLGYSHVRHSVRLEEDGTLTVQSDDGSMDVFGEGQGGLEVIQELVEKAQTADWGEVYSEIMAKEMEIFNALADGSALEQHMEIFYLETLRACATAIKAKRNLKA